MNLGRSLTTSTDVINRWLRSGETIRLSGLDLRPIQHPAMEGTPLHVLKGQAAVYFLEQRPHGNKWLLKKFAPSRQPPNSYLAEASRCLPGGHELFTCTQRRLLNAAHFDRIYSRHKDPDLISWLEGAVLMPKVPGSPWTLVADALRAGELEMPLDQRVAVALNLARCIERLEAWGVSHRDLSSGNVFVAPDNRIYLIDLDSLFHPNLAFPANTTAGTNGYMARFLRGRSGDWDASRSWCRCADRVALAVLIAEFLLIGPRGPASHEDGTLFSQAQLEQPDGDFVRSQVESLWKIGRDCGILLWKALRATTFGACPSPGHWQAALRRVFSTVGAHCSNDSGKLPRRSPRHHPCAGCGVESSVKEATFTGVQHRGKPALCSSYPRPTQESWFALQSKLDADKPQILCEHCLSPMRILRLTLDLLRSKGKPILCRSCLAMQMQVWKSEQTEREREYPAVVCAECGARNRLHRKRLQSLQAAGKVVLCRECLQIKLQHRRIQTSSILFETRRSL